MGKFNYLSSSFDSDVKEAIRVAAKEIKKRAVSSDASTAELLEFLSKVDFWCGNDYLHIENPDYQKGCTCCMGHIVGLPRHPATKLEMPLTHFQVDLFNRILKAVTQPEHMNKEEWDRLHHMFHINKGRQMGFTEIILRIIQFFCFSRYAGSNVGIIAATNGKLANKDLRRFGRLFKAIPKVVAQGVKSSTFKLVNNTTIEAFPASEEAMTGDTNYACIFMDESAKWKLVEDRPIFNSILPIVRSNGADLFLVSTPKGPLKMFYKITKDPQEFMMFEYDIWNAEGNIYTKPQIEQLLASTKEDPNQEYLCKFTIGEDSILGAITDDERSDKVVEWGNEDTNEEDDNYVEDTSDDPPDWDQD